MISAVNIALAGMRAATDRVNIRSENIANVLTPGYQYTTPFQTAEASGPVVVGRREGPGLQLPAGQTSGGASASQMPIGGDDSNLARDIVDMRMAAHAYAASASVIRTNQQMQAVLLDIVG